MALRGRIYPAEGNQFNLESGRMAVVSVSRFGGEQIMSPVQQKETGINVRPTLSQPRAEQTSSLEHAYWSNMRKRAGMPPAYDNEKQQNETTAYEQFRREMASCVEKNFRQKDCIKFIPKPNQNAKKNKDLKCHCGEILSLHSWGMSFKDPATAAHYVHEDFMELARNLMGTPPRDLPQVKWDPAQCLRLKPSWTYGKMDFNVESSQGKKPAKYLRLASHDSVDDCLKFMVNYWKIMKPTPPNLVISVVGGAKNFVLDGEMRETFSNGLIKAAKTTNAWLITSGFNMGVMRSVGQAVSEGQAFLWDNDRLTHLLRCIAIAPWGYVYNRRFLEGRNKKGRFNAYYRASNMILHGQPVSLNPDHTHFIFVDDGYRNRYGGVADFRAQFERKLSSPKSAGGYGIPVVMMVLEGGPDCIQDACQSLKEGIPVVVCTGTGRAADFLTYAHKFTHKDRNGERVMYEQHKERLRERVAEAYSKNWRDKAEEELNRTMDTIHECMQRDHLMVFFDLQREEDLDVAILSVLTKAERSSGTKNRLSQLELALTWNRADIAQSEIFREDVNWDSDELYKIMTKALQEDKMSFVRLLLNEDLSMREYLTVPRLEELYNTLPKQGYLHVLLKRKLGKEIFTVNDIAKFLKEMLERFDIDIISEDSRNQRTSRNSRLGYSKMARDTTDTEVEAEPGYFHRPYKHLLIWAVLLNRPDLAKFFWEMGEEPITSALSVSLLCIRMHRIIPKYLHSVREDFISMKKMFEGLATKVLDECHAVDPEKAMMLVERNSPSWSRMTCLQIAAAADNQLFVSSAACQNSVNTVWKNGILSDWRRVFLCALLPFLILPVISVAEIGGRPVSSCQKFLTYITSPIVKFSYYMLSYLAFLMTYTYMVLVDFEEYPSELEIFLMVWIISFFVSELHTFIMFPSPTFWGKIRDWFGFLNRLELANILLAFIAFVLRYDSKFYLEAKTLYCINIVIFYIRIIKVYIANSDLGPKLYMIFRMVEELVMFMLVLVVFLLAYGVCSQGMLYKRRKPSFDIVKDLIQFPYWQLYGELYLEEIQTDSDCLARQANGSSVPPYENYCRESYWLVYIMLGLYLLVGNVLLLNLLIAIFSNVFNQVEENSIEIWKYQMYFLVMEFQCKAMTAPPLSLLEHFFILVRFLVRRSCCTVPKEDPFGQYHLTYLALFEKEMMGNYLRRIKFQSMDSVDRKFVKLQKRVDMLIKIIEEKHVEDELSMQSSHMVDSRLNDLTSTVHSLITSRPQTSDTGQPDSRMSTSSNMGSLTAGLLWELAESAGVKADTQEVQDMQTVKVNTQTTKVDTHTIQEEQDAKSTKKKSGKEFRVLFKEELPELRREATSSPAADVQSQDRRKPIRHASEDKREAFRDLLPFGRDEEEEEKKKRRKKKKKKEKRHEKSRERQTNFEQKELNINVPEHDSKPALEKHISDEDNEGAEVAMPESQSLMLATRTLFVRAPKTRAHQTTSKPSTQPDLGDMGDEPGGESEEEENLSRPVRPHKRLSRGVLNMLTNHKESRDALSEDEQLSGNSDFDLRPRQPPSPRHKKKKEHRKERKESKKQKKKKPLASSDSEFSDHNSM